MAEAVSLGDIQDARTKIAPHIRRTPVIGSEALDERFGSRLVFKCENLQHTGSFKVRGATNAVLSLTEEVAPRGVAAHSSGNHAAALARAAALRGIPCHVVMPEGTRPNKVANVRRFGAKVTFCNDSAEARESVTAEIVDRTGATLVHPYDDPRTIAGQGTVGLETLEQAPDIDAIIVPVGGGGLTAGILTAVRGLGSPIEVIAAEPAVDRDAFRSWQSGTPSPSAGSATLADGLRAPLGALNTAIIHRWLDDMLHPSESAIAAASRLLTESTRTVVEPSAAVGLAGLLEDFPTRLRGKRIALVVTGGNLNLDDLPWARPVGNQA